MCYFWKGFGSKIRKSTSARKRPLETRSGTDDFTDFQSELDFLEDRISGTQHRKLRRSRRRFEETNVKVLNPSANETFDVVSGQDASQWQQMAEAAIEHERNSSNSYMLQIAALKAKLSKSEKKAVSLQDQLIAVEQKQQQAFVDQIRKEERLRSKQERFMAEKFADLSAESEQKLASVRMEASANVSRAESLLTLERQRLLNSTRISENLRQQVEKWRDAAKRSMKLGEGKADLMEELDDMKLKFRAAAHVAEKWRNQSLHVLEILMNVMNEESLSPVEEKMDSAGSSPESFQKVLNEVNSVIEKREEKKQDEEKQRQQLASSYAYPSWELNGVTGDDTTVSSGKNKPRTTTTNSDPRAFMNTVLPMTSISDLRLGGGK